MVASRLRSMTGKRWKLEAGSGEKLEVGAEYSVQSTKSLFVASC